MSSLPDDIWYSILNLCGLESVLHIFCTCKDLSQLKTNTFWQDYGNKFFFLDYVIGTEPTIRQLYKYLKIINNRYTFPTATFFQMLSWLIIEDIIDIKQVFDNIEYMIDYDSDPPSLCHTTWLFSLVNAKTTKHLFTSAPSSLELRMNNYINSITRKPIKPYLFYDPPRGTKEFLKQKYELYKHCHYPTTYIHYTGHVTFNVDANVTRLILYCRDYTEYADNIIKDWFIINDKTSD